jgi:diaminopimelate epimerase
MRLFYLPSKLTGERSMINFTKMLGTGNDYIYINTIKETVKKPSRLAIDVSDRHRGIGGDGLILIMEPTLSEADFRMRIFNADGSEAEMCGNGIRCFAKYVYDRRMIRKESLAIETPAGIKNLELTVRNKKVTGVTVDMGEPILRRDRIPMLGKQGMVTSEILQLPDGTHFEITALSMGNPHVVIFVEDVRNFPVEKYGPIIENHNLFPQRTNVEFIQVLNRREIVQRTWERGSGETLACGTGASAATVASILTGQTDRSVKVHLSGGDLGISWKESDNHVYMSGPAVEVFEGVWPHEG